jgi:hypothetical protein
MKVIDTKTIGEKVLLLDPGDLETSIPSNLKNLVTYTHNELKVIKEREITGEELKFLHGIKKDFPGSIIKRANISSYMLDISEQQ